MNYPLLYGSENIRDTFLWLGGTVTEDWDWRKELIPYLDKSIVYYDPYIRPEDNLDWDETARKNEQTAKAYARCQIYAITSGMKGCFTIEEITEAALTSKKGSVAVAILDRDNKFTKEMRSSLDACMERWVELGVVQCPTLISLARFANDYKASQTVHMSSSLPEADSVRARSHF